MLLANKINDLELPDDKVDKYTIREKIINFESKIKDRGDVFVGDSDICPLKHSFSDGIYVREIFIPAGTFIVGKIHKHAHPNFLLSGTVDVLTENDGSLTLEGPKSMISSAGTKRALYAITDCVWITVHHNPDNLTDLSKLEDLVIAKDYDEYEKFISNKIGWVKKISNLFSGKIIKKKGQ